MPAVLIVAAAVVLIAAAVVYAVLQSRSPDVGVPTADVPADADVGDASADLGDILDADGNPK